MHKMAKRTKEQELAAAVQMAFARYREAQIAYWKSCIVLDTGELWEGAGLHDRVISARGEYLEAQMRLEGWRRENKEEG